MPTGTYRGRFAPSPTGPLHFGSLVAAVGSFLCARAQGGEWFVRIEDLDPPREVAGAADDILRTLDSFGLHWDGEVMYQSRRRETYEAALAQLKEAGVLYPCACTRREIADSSVSGIEGPVYPGTCRAGLSPGRVARAWRVRTDNRAIEFEDGLQGVIRSALADDIGDFVVQRADGFFAYQLAVVVDDAAQGISEIVRGADLLDSTPRQIHLQRLLGLPTPGYLHLPVVLNANGEKLSKQTQAVPLDRQAPVTALWAALAFLGQSPDPAWRTADLRSFWGEAIARWSPARLPRQRGLAPATY
ncbi:MAG: tRNA glutamyl-Q(34) synthetase GluQRS [Candidatus Muproteobacteria bacterium RBG_16_64_11]|uniref:Glutamyl-Q tRNA(Asp) synthetase n=1 Tax=Candidatus Muproteobacteria bacterium RBG_16_64_11 TaxID=1817758 RepID=A0A1F6TBA4_9PROT|nr:MAG: tRNA glutamyl-Q(34) synthetase GluQRS [Candidatus Muproteobacteria bacterium RBG_16_64_11]